MRISTCCNFSRIPREGTGALEQITVKSKVHDVELMVPDKTWIPGRDASGRAIQRGAGEGPMKGILKLAYKLLVNDKAKFTALLVGITFAVFLMIAMTSLFAGVLNRASATVINLGASMWIMDPAVQTVANTIGMPDYVLDAARSIQGVNYAVPVYSGGALVKLADGTYQAVNVVGLDDTSLFGRPQLIQGKIEDIYGENAFIVVKDPEFPKLDNPRSRNRI